MNLPDRTPSQRAVFARDRAMNLIAIYDRDGLEAAEQEAENFRRDLEAAFTQAVSGAIDEI